jgi:uncharacterized membrane protein YebE (DUF533 family)
MSAQSMLAQRLKSGMSWLDGKGQGSGAPAEKSPANWGQIGAGVATGGALGWLLGRPRGGSFGGKALKYGSLAALDAVAFKAFRTRPASMDETVAEGVAAQRSQTASDILSGLKNGALHRRSTPCATTV